jgi:hypothetical protein
MALGTRAKGFLGTLIWIALTPSTLACDADGSAPAISIERPYAGEVLSGEVAIVVKHRAPFAYRGWTLAFDGESTDGSFEKRAPGTTTIKLDATRLTNGKHTAHATMYAWPWRNWRADTSFVVDNPPQRVVRLEHHPAPPGQPYLLELDVNLPDLELRVSRGAYGVRAESVDIRRIGATHFELRFPTPGTEAAARVEELQLSLSNGTRVLLVPVELISSSGPL